MSRFHWRIHGDRTLAYRLDDREVPGLFDEEFELGADEAVAILHGERGLESLTRATLKTGGGLDWIRKFFCRGEPLSVLFHKAGPAEFVLHFHAPCSDGEPLEGAARVSAAVSSMRSALLIPFFGTNSALAVDDLLDPLEKILSEALVPKAKWEKIETFRTAPPALQKVEEALTPVLRDAMKAMGLGPGKIVWVWATDEEQRERIHGHLERRAEIAETLGAERAEFSRERPLRLLGTHLALLKTAREMLVAAETPRDLDIHLRAALGHVRSAEGAEEPARETLDDTLEEEIERVSEDLKQKKILLGVVDEGETLSEAEPKGPTKVEGKPHPTPGEAAVPPAPPGGEAPEVPSPASPVEDEEPAPESESGPEEVPTYELPPLTEALKLDEGAPAAPAPAAQAEIAQAEIAQAEIAQAKVAQAEVAQAEVVPEEVSPAEALPVEAPPPEIEHEEAATPEVLPETPSPEEASRPEAVHEAALPEDEAALPEAVPDGAARTAEEGEQEPVAEAAREADSPERVFSTTGETAGAFEPSVPAPGQAAEVLDEEESLSPQELLARFLERTAGMRFTDRPPPEEVQEEAPATESPETPTTPVEDAPVDASRAELAAESTAPPPEATEPTHLEAPSPEREAPAGAETEPAVEVVETEPAEASPEPSAPLPAAAPVPEEAGEGIPLSVSVSDAGEPPAPEGQEEAEEVEEIEEIEDIEPLEEIKEEPAPSVAAKTVVAAAVESAAAAVESTSARPKAPPRKPAAAPRPKPEVRVRPVRVAYEWRLYGEDSLAYRLQDCEMPLLLREDFDVGPAQAALVLRGTQCMEVMTTGAVRSGTGLQWIRRLFGPGADICVLFVVTTPIPLVLDLFSWFADAEPVAAEVTLKLRIAPASAAGLISLLDAEGALSGRGLREIFTHSVVLPVVERELSASVSGGSGGLAFSFLPVETAVREAVKKVAFSWGFLVDDLSFHWGANPVAFREIDDAAWKRATAEWEMKTRGRLAAAEHASSLLARRTEGLRSLSAALSANAGADMMRFLTRAALGIEALEEGNPPDRHDVRQALEENLAESQKAMDALAGTREETSRELAAGPPPRPERRTGEEAEADDFGFLSEGDDDALDTFAFSFHQPIRESPSAPPSPPPSATHAPAFERRSYAPSALSNMGGGAPGAQPTLGDLSAPIGATAGSVNRCPFCLSSVKPGWTSCGNCGRLLPTS